jgi:hypothetical protein
MLALIFYKPLAAMVYATIFTLIGNSSSLHSCLMAVAMMVIALVAFPVLLKFFSWTTGGTDSAGSGALLAAVIGGATAVGAMRGGFGSGPGGGKGDDPVRQSRLLDQNLGKPGEDQPHRPPGTTGPADPGEPTPHTDGRSATTTADDLGRPDGSGSPGPAGTPPDTPADNPGEGVGPAAFHTAEQEQRRAQAPLRWMNQPTGSADGGTPTGAEGGGSGG